VKFNRNVEKDIFGYFCLSFLNEDGEISEKKVRHDFSKFGEVVSVRGALGKQKGHVFVRFRKKEAAENCLNCLNSFPLSEMSELFGRYLFLSPATPRDIDCDMFGLYSISFLNLNIRTFREIRAEFSKFGEIVRLTSGGGGNTDELVSISYSDKVLLCVHSRPTSRTRTIHIWILPRAPPSSWSTLVTVLTVRTTKGMLCSV
jgi:hypothetical protein